MKCLTIKRYTYGQQKIKYNLRAAVEDKNKMAEKVETCRKMKK
jgi:hypothetical protein